MLIEDLRVLLLLALIAIISSAIAVVLSMKNKTYRKYIPYFEAAINKDATLEIIMANLDAMISLLDEELKKHSVEKEKEELGAYIAFLKNLDGWKNVSYIQINLKNNLLPEWMKMITKNRFMVKIRNFMLFVSGSLIWICFVVLMMR